MIRTPFVLNLVVLGLSLTTLPVGTPGELLAQAPRTTGHEHLARSGLRGRAAGREAARVRLLQHRHGQGTPVPVRRPSTGILRAFGSRQAAEAARSCDRNSRGGRRPRVALGVRGARRRSAWQVKLSPSSDRCSFQWPRVTAPFSRTRSCGRATVRGSTHTRARRAGMCSRESSAWRLPQARARAGAGQTMTVPANVPMELNVTGTALRRAFALVIHDSTQERGASHPTGSQPGNVAPDSSPAYPTPAPSRIACSVACVRTSGRLLM